MVEQALTIYVFQLRMRESYKRFVKTWIRFANPWICFVSIRQFSKDSIRGFVSWCNFQKIRFVDSYRDPVFNRFVLWIRFGTQFSKDSTNPTNPTNPYESFGFGFANPLVFKRFVLWIRFVLRCSKDSFRGFVLWHNFQKICFVDSFPKIKNSKLLDSFHFGRIRIRIPHP